AVLSFYFSEIQYFLINQIGYSAEDIFHLSAYRLFGYADNLTYSAPAFQAFIVFFFYLYQSKYNKIWWIIIPIIIFSAVINARTSIVILMGAFVMLLTFKSEKWIKKILGLFLIIILGLFLLYGQRIVINTDNYTL